MRNWLLVVLLVFLSLQSTWAAAVSYYQYESGVAVQYVEHHAHQHAVLDGKLEAKFLKSALMGDADCDFCHPCCGALFIEVPSVLQYLMALDFNLVYQDRKSLIFLAFPDRPNWQYLV